MNEVEIKAGRWKYLVVARDDFSGCPETVSLTRLTAKSVSEWFNSQWICRYGAPKEVTVEGGEEFGKELQESVKRAGSRIRRSTPYYPEAQGMVERGHKQLKDALVKRCGENGSKWKEYLPILTLADRILVKRTGYSPFELQSGQQAVLTIDIETNTYLAVEWNKTSTTKELLEARAIQISEKEETKIKEVDKLRDSRKKSVQYLDKKLAHKLINPLQPGDLVLVYHTRLESQWGLPFKNCWNGQFRVISQVNKGPYEPEELDGTKLTRKFEASHIKRFYARGKIVHLDSESEN
ncbi:hypothetical protein O181_062532 [Austropuccinia psidii MF-1]|uniref:Integrase catalytic domain-containing protein n=1 Tax=Austropuccinia psidii MF-1 TaxID=1389203 RepID=A0A9Q3EMU1_9BASI|nr:hypothetical protein [Austropuccinia psidii MF-1]